MQLPYTLAGISFHHFSILFWWLACMSACVFLLFNCIVFANIDYITFDTAKRFITFENFAGFFLLGVGYLKRSKINDFYFFLKLKTTFCRYWTLIKSKISMTCVHKEYEVKTKIVQEQWLQLNIKFVFFWVGGGQFF